MTYEQLKELLNSGESVVIGTTDFQAILAEIEQGSLSDFDKNEFQCGRVDGRGFGVDANL